MKNLLYILFITQIILFQSKLHANAEELTGKWCDKPTPGLSEYNSVLEFVVTEVGNIKMKLTYADGGERFEDLEDLGNKTYGIIRNRDFGDKYRLVPDFGYLQILDNEGLIRTALPLNSAIYTCFTD